VRGRIEFSQQHLQDALDILQHFVVPEADHAVSERPQIGITLRVIGSGCVLAAVHFYNEPPLAAQKVGVISPDWFLPDELECAELAVAQMAPKRLLRLRHRTAEGPCPPGSKDVRTAHESPLTLSLSPQAGRGYAELRTSQAFCKAAARG
jgi:hypothetical protein